MALPVGRGRGRFLVRVISGVTKLDVQEREAPPLSHRASHAHLFTRPLPRHPRAICLRVPLNPFATVESGHHSDSDSCYTVFGCVDDALRARKRCTVHKSTFFILVFLGQP